MSISLMTYAWRIPCAENSDKLVLMKLCDHANDDGVCWPSWGHLVKHTGLSRATVARCLGRLEEAGIISRESRTGTSTVYTIHDEVMKRLTPVELRGHKSKGYHGETPVDPSNGETSGSHDETTTSLTVRPPPSHCETLIIRGPPNKTINESTTSKTLADIGKLVENTRLTLQHVKSKYYIVFLTHDLNVSNDPTIRLASLYARWIWHSHRDDTKAEMNLFASVIRPYLSKYTDPRIASWIRRYCEGISDPKFRSVRKLVETEDALCWPKRKHWPAIDKYSDFTVEEQAANYLQMYGEYEQ